ncbi:hypothetical protein V1512DRAFT_260333 [Lipomyces arxii]|uniref:uncharacterized protein n=1 Tax=Lipomyces arxii TaxID=56418 RepID=UPI0034CF97B2
MTDIRTARYKAFLLTPKADHLVESDANLTYITSCQSFKGTEAILSNTILNSRHVKKFDKFISEHIAADSIVFEIISTIEFVNGTGSYVPGLDKNFVVDHTVILPIIHSVVFQGDKIKSVRLFWDQGSMLKQLGIIGARGNVWPIFSGSEQEKLMMNDTVPTNATPPFSKLEIHGRREPFKISELDQEDEVVLPRPAAIAHSVSAKPQPRSFQNILDSDEPAPASPMRRGNAPEAYNMFDEKSNAYLTHKITKVPAPEFSTPEQIRAKRNFNAKNFEPHFQFGVPDNKPEPQAKTRSNMHPQPDEPSWDYGSKGAQDRVVGAGRQGMLSDLKFTDSSPARPQKFNGIKIAGNGMGGRGELQKSWDIGDDDDEEDAQNQRKVQSRALAPISANNSYEPLAERTNNGRGGRADMYRTEDVTTDKDDRARFQGIKIAGNGMGSRGKPQWSLNMGGEDENDVPSAKKIDPFQRTQVEPATTKFQGRVPSRRQFQSSWSFGHDADDKEH